MDRGAWWVAQSRTWLKRLSSWLTGGNLNNEWRRFCNMTAVKVSMRKEVANKGRNGSCLQELFWEGRTELSHGRNLLLGRSNREQMCHSKTLGAPSGTKAQFHLFNPSAGEAAASHKMSLSNPNFLWCYYFPMADITFFFLSNNVFEIKLIIMFQRRETLSYTLCGPTVPRTINKIHKNCSINMGCLIFFDTPLCPSSCHNHWSWSTSCRASKRKNSHTHMHGYLEGNGRRIERRVLNCTCLHRFQHTVNETKDIMLVSRLCIQDHTQQSLASFPYLSLFSAL